MDAVTDRLTFDTIRRLRNAGMSFAEIGRTYSVSRQAVHKMWRHGPYGPYQTPRERAKVIFAESIPERPEHWDSTIGKSLRLHLEWVIGAGEGMDADKAQRLRAFYRKLADNGWVVEYHPDTPPAEGNKHGGYAFRDRTETDGDLVIRQNYLVTLGEDVVDYWRIPDEWPSAYHRPEGE